MNIRDCIRKRLAKSVADKAALEHKQSKTKSERPALIKFDKEHQIRELDLYAEYRRPRLELAMEVCFAVLLVGSMVWLSSLARSLQANTISSDSMLGFRTLAKPVAVTPPKMASGVYVDDKHSVMRLDAQTGKVIWTYNSALSVVKIIPANNMIYLAFADGEGKATVVALDADSGKLRWSYQTSVRPPLGFRDPGYTDRIISLAVQDSSVYVKTSTDKGNVIHKLDATSGSQLTQFSIPFGIEEMEVTKDMLYITASDGLHAFDTSNGKLRWQVKMPASSASSVEKACIYGEMVLTTILTLKDDVSSNALLPYTVLAAFDARTGQKWWQSQSLSGYMSDLTVADNTIYVGTEKLNQTKWIDALSAYDARNGKLMWESDSVGDKTYAPTAANGVVYYSASDSVFAADATTGRSKWTHKGITTSTSMHVSNGVLYAMDNSSVYALKASDGTLMWKFALNERPSPFD